MNAFKKIIAFAIVGTILCAGFTACSSTNEPPIPENKLVLTAIPMSVKVGAEVTFKVTDDGKDVTASAQIKNMTESGTVVTSPWSTTKPGVYQFTAVYDERTSTQISVTVRSDAEPSNYKRRVLAVDFTGTQCTFCPPMTTLLTEYQKANPDRLVLMAAHVDIPAADPLTTKEAREMISSLGINTAPLVWIDYRETPIGPNATTFNGYVARSLSDYPAICGLKIDSSVKDLTITANVAARFSADGTFKICAAVLEDNITVANSVEKTYNHVLRQFATPVKGDEFGTYVAGQEKTKTFTFTADPSWNLANCHVVVYLLNANDGQYFVNNVRACPANGSADFEEE